MAQKRVCRDFIENPKRDPLDYTHRLIPGKGPYRGFVKMCLENGFDVEYMLDENFINELSPNRSTSPVRSTSPSRSPSRLQRSSSPTRSTSVLASQPMLPKPTLPSRSVSSVTRPDNLQSRSVSDNRLTNLSSQTVYPRVVGPSRTITSSQSKLISQPGAVPRSYVQRTEQIGTERFDPDPVTTVTKIPERSERKTVQGPYGDNGENVLISGVHKLPGQLVYTTSDIPEHEVRSVHNGYNTSSVNNRLAASGLSSVNNRPVINNTLPIVNNKLPIVNNKLPIVNTRPLVNDALPVNGRSVINNTLPINNNGSLLYSRPLASNRLPVDRPLFNIPLTTNNVPSINNMGSIRPLYPQPSYNTRTERIGNETFDPDPITTINEIPPTSSRMAVRGPYGSSGEDVITTGVYTAPGRRVYSTSDIPEHEVRSMPRSTRNGEF